jgi:hypothetical protein
MGGTGVKRGSRRERKRRNWMSQKEELRDLVAELVDQRKQLLSPIAALEEADVVNR